MCMWVFVELEKKMSLCNQLLLQFSMDHFETMHIGLGYIEDMLVNFFLLFLTKLRQVCVINFSQGLQAINLKLCTYVISIMKMCR